MNLRTFNRTVKNLEQFGAFIKKMDAKGELTEAESKNLTARKAQCIVWQAELEAALEQGLSGEQPADGEMSASSAASTSESANAG